MVNKVEDYTSGYEVTAKERRIDARSVFLEVTDKLESSLRIVLHYVDGDIYSIKFLNNDFFEIAENDLWHTFQKLLSGGYEIKKSRFRGVKSVKIGGGNNEKEIYPERIDSSSAFEEEYGILPRSFTKKIEHRSSV